MDGSLIAFSDAVVKIKLIALLIIVLKDSQIAGTMIESFMNSLQSSLSIKQRLAVDLEDMLLNPLQRLMKQELRDFKEARKSFDKMLDKYENHLSKYSLLSKQKEASALREDAFQMHDVRKSYIRACGEYFGQVISFKSNLENTLVECFSGALGAQVEEIDERTQAYSQPRTMLPGWRQWLEESKNSCEYQLQKIQESCHALEDSYIQQTEPRRSLKTYSITELDQAYNAVAHENSEDKPRASTKLKDTVPEKAAQGSHESEKDVLTRQGYLFCRIAVGKPVRFNWVRRWFFLQDGWFGMCTVSTVDKTKGCIVVGDRIKVQDCTGKVNLDTDRRFCFEVSGSQCSFFLQAETEKDMHQWLSTIDKYKVKKQMQTADDNKEADENQNVSDTDTITPQALLSPKTQRRILNNRRKSGSSESHSAGTVSSSSLSFSDTKSSNESTSPDVSTTYSLTSLMIREGSKNNLMKRTNSGTRYQKSMLIESSSGSSTPSATEIAASWGMPWIISGISAFSSGSPENSSGGNDSWISRQSANEPRTVVVWPTKLEMDAPTVTLSGYSAELAARQRELRKLFANVSTTEVVMEAFSASLYRTPAADLHWLQTASSEQPNADSSLQRDAVISEEYGYSGYVYVTQTNLWFYSCMMMTCLNMLVLPLDKIKSIRLERALSATSQGMLMFIDTKSQSSQTFCFGLWLESAELIGERLRTAVEVAKNSEKIELQVLYDSIRSITPGRLKSKTPISHVTPVSALNAAVTPLTVQAYSQSPTVQPSKAAATKQNSDPSPADSESSVDVEENGMENTNESKPSPAAGALTAAMEAAAATSRGPTKRKGSLAKATNKAKIDIASNLYDWPDNLQKPKGPVTCDCNDHLDKKEAEVVLQMSAKQLFEYLFSEKLSGSNAGENGIWAKLNKVKGNSGKITTFNEMSQHMILMGDNLVPDIYEWQDNTEGGRERQLQYLMPVNNPMLKTKETEVMETHQILKDEEYICYVVELSTKAPNLPYADAFVPLIKLCITYVSPKSCRLICSTGVKWQKSIMMKGMVNKAANKGMAETVNALLPIIQHEASSGKSNQLNEIDVAESVSVHTRKGKEHERQGHLQKFSRDYKNPIANLLGSVGEVNFKWVVIACIIILGISILTCRGGKRKIQPAIKGEEGGLVWRAVFLRDIEEKLDGSGITLERANTRTYKSFQDARVDAMHINHKWFSARHRRMAGELSYTRERLGAMRYELLSAFHMLNGVEHRLLESEYWNWLLDENLRCKTEYLTEGCDEVLQEIEFY
ncbi:SNF1-interacting protein [Apophysomyces sp. BC1015]|nr:SNF1-interacting protein [Apophysomyces sp. BC1015]